MTFPKVLVQASCFSFLGIMAQAEAGPPVSPTVAEIDLYVVGAPVKSVLEQVMLALGAEAKIADGVHQIAASYRVAGDKTRIFADMAQAFDLVFFEFNDIVYVSSAVDLVTKIIKIEGSSAAHAIAALRASGLPLGRFSVAPVAGSDTIVMTAPEDFVALAEALLLSMSPEQEVAAAPEAGIKIRRGVSVTTEMSN